MSNILIKYIKGSLNYFACIGSIVAILLLAACQSRDVSLKKESSLTDDQKARQESELRWQKELQRRKALELEKEKQAQSRKQKKLEEDRIKNEQLAIAQKKEQEEQLRIQKENELKERQRRAELEKKQKADQQRKELQERKRARIQKKVQNLEYAKSFWFVEDQATRFDTIIFEGSGQKNNQIVLYKNLDPRQLHSFSKKNLSNSYKLEKVESLPYQVMDISQILWKNEGHLVLFETREIGTDTKLIAPLKIRLKDKSYYIIDLYSDGEDLMFADLESTDQKLEFRRIMIKDAILQP